MSAIKCNGCAWGTECPARSQCALWVTPEQWAAGVRNGMPNIKEAEAGYRLLACHLPALEHFQHKETTAIAYQAAGATMELF